MSELYSFVNDLEKDFELLNDRGSLVQLVHSGYLQVNVVCSYANTNRGGHMHKDSKESFYIVDGCVEVELWKREKRMIKSYKKGDFFEIQPGIMHALKFPTDCVMVVLYDVPIEHEDGVKDIYSEEID